MAYVLVMNTRAGSAEREAVEAAEAVLRRHGCDLVETRQPDDVDDVIARLDGRQLVVAGGDGSLHLAVERLRHSGQLDEVVIGWVPLGTGNDLARTLGVPLDPEEAARVVVRSHVRRLDLVVSDDGRVCVNALHAGVGVDAAARAAALKERVGEFAYPLGALAAGATADGWRLSVEVDGEPLHTPEDGNVLLVAVMNGRTLGGGTAMSPGAEPDDGSVDVVACSALGPAQRAAFGVALRTGRHLERDDVVFRRGANVRISGQPVSYNIDGELEDHEVADRRFHVEPAGWRIIAPA